MIQPINKHVGSRIRQYRKARGLSASRLAELVHKSKSTMSKYESGHCAIEAATLFEIAQVLGVSMNQLFDYQPKEAQTGEGVVNPFAPVTQLYLYHLHHKKINSSVLQLHITPHCEQIEATLFYSIDSMQNMEQCKCIYHGQLFNHQTVVNLFMRNYYNSAENVLLNFLIPMRKIKTVSGIIYGLDSTSYIPTAYKMLLSLEPLPIDEQLLERLTIPAETYKQMKRKNMLFVPLDSDD